MEKLKLTLLILLISSNTVHGQSDSFYSKWEVRNPLLEICYGNCNPPTVQPRNVLYGYHDGGFRNDRSRTQLIFDDEKTTDEMLRDVRKNIDIRINDLHNRNNELINQIGMKIETVLIHDKHMIREGKELQEIIANAFKTNLDDPSFQFPSELLNQIEVFNNLEINLNNIQDQIDNLKLDLDSEQRVPDEHILPVGFDFPGFEFRSEFYEGMQLEVQRQATHEWLTQEKDYAAVQVRFNQFTSRDEEDPVFPSIESLLLNQHEARMSIMFSRRAAQDYEEIKRSYPSLDPSLIEKWIRNGKVKRYQALNYLPLSDDNFRFSVLDMNIVRSEITNVLEEIQDDFPIPKFACNFYTATVANKIYNVDMTLFKNERGEWLNANTLAFRATIDDRFIAIGEASDQQNLDMASYYATIGMPVIAVWANPSGGDGHVNLLLPGMNDFKSSTWQKYVPWVTNYSKTEGNVCNGCFTEGRLSDAFAQQKMDSVILYILDRKE